MPKLNLEMTNQKVYFDGSYLQNYSGIGRDSRNLLVAARMVFGENVQVIYPKLRFFSRTVQNKNIPANSIVQKVLRFRSLALNSPEICIVEPNSIFIQSHLNNISPIKDPTITYIVRLHDLFPLTNPEWFRSLSKNIFEIGFKNASSRANFICDSRHTESELVKILGSTLTKSSVAICPVAVPNNAKCGQCEGCKISNQNEKHIIAISTLEPRKNYLELLSAWQLLVDNEKSNAWLYIVGGKGWKSRTVRQKLRKLKRDYRVCWIQNACDGSVRSLLRTSECLVSNSFEEGFNLSVAEAIVQRVPVLISKNNVHRELYKNLATFYDLGDPSQLAKKIYLHLRSGKKPLLLDSEIKSLADYDSSLLNLANEINKIYKNR
jgi:glycosyltransferase involved in cell wall biosynthesis